MLPTDSRVEEYYCFFKVSFHCNIPDFDFQFFISSQQYRNGIDPKIINLGEGSIVFFQVEGQQSYRRAMEAVKFSVLSHRVSL